MDKISKRSMSLCEGPFLKKIILYSLPIVATGILQLLFNAADMIVVGRFCGENSLGAVGATTPIIHLTINLFLGLSVGAGVCVAQSIGAKADEKTSLYVHTAIPMALVGGVLITLIGILCTDAFLDFTKTPEELVDLSALYMKIYFAGTIPNIVYNFGAAILRADGDTRSPLVFLSLSGILNVILNIFFVTAVKMNVAGVAIATVISQTLSSVLVLISLSRRHNASRLVFKKMRFSVHAIIDIIKIGLPAGIQSSLFSISNVIIQSSINSFGAVVLDGSTAAASLEGFTFTAMDSFTQTATNFTSQNVGAKKYSNIPTVFTLCMLLVTVVGLAFGVTTFAFAKPLLSIYLPEASESVSYGVTRLAIIPLTYFTCGIMNVASGIIRGMGNSTQPMLITIVGICVSRIVFVYTLFQIEAFHTFTILLLTYPISWVITFLALLICYFHTFKKLKKSDHNESAELTE